ncbi:hypothetical protein LCGC14_1527250 [marine sediment metagenome]|uniref:Uncharacterized protein n=1 Tax=marine sediment metagenome TaxID=412755 RepID=A0A0F9IWV1_9ZZZZ
MTYRKESGRKLRIKDLRAIREMFKGSINFVRLKVIY